MAAEPEARWEEIFRLTSRAEKAELRWLGYQEKLAEAVALLRETEWIMDVESGERWCQSCNAVDTNGHAPDCPLAKILHENEGGK